MCGIAGLFDPHARGDARRTAAERMVSALAHRGPDDSGFHFSGSLAMGMTRLSIIDVSGGQQPFSSEDGRVTVVCNGEIYNHDELRRQLQGRGHVFRSRSDVEVIVHLYEEFGAGCLEHLRGMFAIALWDEQRQTVLLARDRLGIKPLFYAIDGGRLLFASEIKSLARTGVLDTHLDREALDRYLTLGYVPFPLTIYQEVRKLPPGHRLTFAAGEASIEPYWHLRFDANEGMDEREASARFMTLFREAVGMHLMSDVSVGAFLSGGVDSGMVVAAMSEGSRAPVNTFSIGFGGSTGGYLDERRFARLVSERYGTVHTEFEVQAKVDAALDEAVEAFDEPFADDSVIPTHYICKLARSQVTVALTGLGGDELFGGYERHLGLKMSALYDRVPQFIRQRVVAPLVGRLPERQDGHYTINHAKRFVRAAGLRPAARYMDYVTVFNDELKSRVCTPGALGGHAATSGAAARAYFESPRATGVVDKALYQDLNTYLPEDILALSDRLSMHHALELRVPFLDHRLVEFCATIPASMKIKFTTKKYLLRKIARGFLPAEIFNHRKQGFASPMTAWLRGDLKGYVASALDEKKLARHGLFRPDAVRSLIDAHNNRRETYDRQLFTLLMFQKWHERFM